MTKLRKINKCFGLPLKIFLHSLYDLFCKYFGLWHEFYTWKILLLPLEHIQSLASSSLLVGMKWVWRGKDFLLLSFLCLSLRLTNSSCESLIALALYYNHSTELDDPKWASNFLYPNAF